MISTLMPTAYGTFDVWVWSGERGQEPIALSTPNLDPKREVLLRIHSECITSDVFGSFTCDCGPQKEKALLEIEKHGNGIFIYHRQEGRNMGLFKKIQAYNLMRKGLDTHEANTLLSGSPDAREYSDVLEILGTLLHSRKNTIVLLSNNPYKKLVLEREGYRVVMRPLRIGETIHNAGYIQTKEQKFLHYSATYKPYAGITLSREDIKEKGIEIVELIHSLALENRGREVFLGISVFPQNDDLKNQQLAQELNQFAKNFKDENGVCLVLHMDYNERRQFYRDLKNFLASLEFRYSLQLRFGDNHTMSKIDLEILESLHSEKIIFQIKKAHYSVLENQKFVEYFRLPNTFLLLDESFGTGTRENLASTQERMMGIIKKGISHIAVAGGYSSYKLADITVLEDYFKIPVSVDAESRLHKNGKLNMTEVSAYLSFFFPPMHDQVF